MAVPEISQEALSSFFEKHFSTSSSVHFAEHFLGPAEEAYDEDEVEDDGLGYYPDGVKRTLTDEQIAIFRHSEIESLLRERRHAEEARDTSDEEPPPKIVEHEDGEIEDIVPQSTAKVELAVAAKLPAPAQRKYGMSKKQRKAQQAKEKGFFKQNVKPDLRKRTWDKVDTGMDSLVYDDEPSSAAVQNQAPQRRRISYDDD